jgi:hypothetical protein
MLIYKIRREDGLFSMGGSCPSFKKTGKIWKMKGHLTSHLGQVSSQCRWKYDNCEIVEYELVETPMDTYSINDYLAEIDARHKAEAMKREEYYSKEREKERRRAYEKLKKEFGE